MVAKLIQRPMYLERTLMFRDTDLVKVVTGVRRWGKSSLLQLVRERIEGEGVSGRSFASLNLEDRESGVRTDGDLYEWCKSRMGENKTYLFLDEIQRVEGWHDVVNSLRVGFDCDIYLTGSNAFLLSGELATYLSGRYVEVKMLPLAFREYADFCGLRPAEGNSIMLRDGGDPVLTDDLVMRYLRFGGMPAIASLATTQAQHEGEVLYVQVADSMTDEATRDRELAPLRSIADNHPKWVVVRQGSYPPDIDGIRIVRAADFFLG